MTGVEPVRVTVAVDDPASHALMADAVVAAGGEVVETDGDLRIETVGAGDLDRRGCDSPLRLLVVPAAELLPGGLDEVRPRLAGSDRTIIGLCPSLRPAACPDRESLAERLAGPTTSTLEWIAAGGDAEQAARTALIERYGWPMIRSLIEWQPGDVTVDDHLDRVSGSAAVRSWIASRSAMAPLLAARRRLVGDAADPERELIDYSQLAAVEALDVLARMPAAPDIGDLDTLIETSLVTPDAVGEEQLATALRASATDDLVVGTVAQLAARSIEVAMAGRSAE